jgi:hypothetical protein
MWIRRKVVMIKHNYITNKSWLLLGILCIGIAACNEASSSHVPEETAGTPTPSISVLNSLVVYATMEELLEYTDIVILGRPVSEQGIINTARDPQDLTRTDPEYFSIGQVYEVEVIRYILGEGADTLYVIQHHGMVRLDSQELSESDIEQVWVGEEITPLALNERYVLFLSYSEYAYEGYPTEQLAGGVGHPWRFRITEQDCVLAEDSDPWLLGHFPPQTLDGFIQWIENPGIYVGNYPYPAPEVLYPCDVNPLGNPYP